VPRSETVSGLRPAGRCGCARCCPLVFEVAPQRADQRSVEVLDPEAGGRDAGALLSETKKQPQGVPVGGDDVEAGFFCRVRRSVKNVQCLWLRSCEGRSSPPGSRTDPRGRPCDRCRTA
jgi:hypothetical protein